MILNMLSVLHLPSFKSGKGILLGIIVLLFFCSGNASAQKYVGGALGLNGTNYGSNPASTTTFNLSPDFGWSVRERWAIGIRPSVRFGVSSSSGDQTKYYSLGINPYARYRMLAWHDFGLWAEADPELSFRYDWAQTQGNEMIAPQTRERRSLNYAVRLLPVLTYQLNSHISLETRLNLFSLALTGRHVYQSDGADSDAFSYSLQATTQDVTDIWDNISIGFLYHF
jgi:hypothetical protein